MYTLAIGYLATGEIFENMLPLKRFGLYFEGIMNKKWPFSCRNNDVSYKDARGFGPYAPREIFKMLDAIWCVFDALF